VNKEFVISESMSYYKRLKRKKKNIAKERMKYLFNFSKKMGLKHEMHYANRYVEIARKIGMRHRIAVPKKYKVLFCRKCGSFLLPGYNSTVRVQNRKVIRHCHLCGAVRRIPLKPKKKHKERNSYY